MRLDKQVGSTSYSVAQVGDETILRERMEPGWRWSVDVKPVVGTELCQAAHKLYVLAGRLHVVPSDGPEFEVGPGESAVILPGHDAWVVGDEACEIIDLSPSYGLLIEAGEAYHALAAPEGGAAPSRADVAARLRERAANGSLDPVSVEVVLSAVGYRSKRLRGPAGLTPRELEVLVLIATGASAKQVARALGIALKTATAHIERIYTKCGVSTRSEVTHFAIANGLVQPLTLTRRPL